MKFAFDILVGIGRKVTTISFPRRSKVIGHVRSTKVKVANKVGGEGGGEDRYFKKQILNKIQILYSESAFEFK